MLAFLESAPDVLAFKIGGKLEGTELDAIMDRLEPMLENEAKTHVFAETAAITGLAIGGLSRYMGRAMPLFGKLGKFGRIAVVADQAWIRWAAKAESLVLPHISYRTFTPDCRAEALAWVQGVGFNPA
ncbi:MAG: STAS/SEC14 domain-containing protein [Rhizobiaceae bacterium]|nr:MAG: STAS/SEC14 domain-containing protein [Rhizobiaceae bacterium]